MAVPDMSAVRAKDMFVVSGVYEDRDVHRHNFDFHVAAGQDEIPRKSLSLSWGLLLFLAAPVPCFHPHSNWAVLEPRCM